MLGVVMEELLPHILVRLDGTIAGVRCQNIRTRALDRELTILVTSYLSSSELSDKLSGLHCGKIIGLCRELAYLQVEDSSLSHLSQVEGVFNIPTIGFTTRSLPGLHAPTYLCDT